MKTNRAEHANTWALRTRLILAFASLALIALVIGVNGLVTSLKSEWALREVGAVRLPSVDSLLRLRAEVERIRGSLRSLAVPGLSVEDRARQYANYDASMESIRDAWAVYEPLPQTPEEAELWREFLPRWEKWSKLNNSVVAMARDFDALGIANPTDTARAFERFAKDHHALADKLAGLLFANVDDFSGGEDHTACNLGKWLPEFTTNNTELARRIQNLEEPHRRFHATVGEIKQLVKAGKIEEARAAYSEKLSLAVDGVLSQFSSILATIETSRDLETRIGAELLGPVTDAQRPAVESLNALSKLNSQVAATEIARAEERARVGDVVSLVAVTIGVVLAVVLGVLITRSITRSINESVVSLATGAESTAAAASQVSSASQSLAEGASEQAASLEETSSSLEELASMTVSGRSKPAS